MRRAKWIAAWAMALCAGSQSAAQWEGTPSGYYGAALPDRLEVDDDPVGRTTGAGPAGGWGVGAASSNPAALLFGSEASASVSLPWSEEYRHMAFGFCSPVGIAAGLAVKSRAGSGYTAAWTLGYRSDSDRAVALALKRRPASAGPAEWLLDFGLRWEGIWPGLSRVQRPDRQSPDLRARWRPGITFGLAITNVAASEVSRYADLPMAIDVGLSCRALIGHPLCLSFNAHQRWYWDTEISTQPYRAAAIRHPGRYAAGLGIEAYEVLEFGLALHGGFPDHAMRFAWSAAVGPPFFRVIWCAGADLVDQRRYGSEFIDLVMVRMYVPVGGAGSETAPGPADPYAFWPDR